MATTEARQTRQGRCECCGAALRTIGRDRRFTLLDAMILVAASAVAFVMVRPMLVGRNPYIGPAWTRYFAVFTAGLVTWTPTALFLKLRSPRPTRLRLSRQPDFAASLAATSILALTALAIAILALVRLARQGARAQARVPMRIPPVDPYWWLGVVTQFASVIGAAVIGAWVVLVISGRHRPSKGWLDLLGRGIGAGWIVVFVVGICARLGYLRD